MAKPEVGKVYVDLLRTMDAAPLVYVGEGTTRYVFETQGEEIITTVVKGRYATDIVPYVEPLAPLGPGSRWERTRHDYRDQVAEVIIPTYQWDGVEWVTYAVIVNGNSTPQTKRVKEFRRIFGKQIHGNDKL